MKMLKKILTLCGYVMAAFIFLIIIIYLLTPVYHFPEPQPFSGDQYFNPYKEIDSTQWKKANFHFHTRAWAGLTSGRLNTHQSFYETYTQLGYHAPQISNYQNIDDYFRDSLFYIPCYEHGYGLWKKHQLLIGSAKVLWLDYPFYQNVNHRQHIINLLRPDNEIIALAHPDWESGYPKRDLKYLSDYDLIEVLNHNWRSVPLWDVALSSGHPVFIVADDDAHDIADPYEIQRCATFINTPVNRGSELISALKTGKAYGAEIYMLDGENFTQKAIRAKHTPRLNSVQIKGDTLHVSVSEKAFKISFIGQNGKIMKNTYHSSSDHYLFKPEDTYIRIEVTFPVYFAYPKVGAGTKFYLNPVFRYDGNTPENSLQATIDPVRTWGLRLLGGALIILAILLIWKIKRKRSFRKN